jgi:leucyl-tRNA synthetase
MKGTDFRKMESKWQKEWENAKVFEAKDKGKKFYMLFAYPTVSGTLHIGHARSYTLPDTIARYKRMRGFNVFFPLGFHATGTDCQNIFEKIKEDVKNAVTYGISESDGKKFRTVTDVKSHLEKGIISSFKRFGLSLDYRAVVSTIDPQYNKFIEWQFKKLNEKRLLIQRDYRLPWCPKDNHPVALDAYEGDIREWKGSTVKEFVIIKFKSQNVVLPASTLRPETIFGVTNLWVKPDAKYKKIKVGKEFWVVSLPAVEKLRNLEKVDEVVGDFDVSSLIGKTAVNPVTKENIEIMPADFVDPEEGTGIVMSVPAHDLFDYIYLKRVRPDIKPIRVVETKDFVTVPSKEMIEKKNISEEDEEKIKEATQELYRTEFFGSIVSSIPNYGGMSVKDAKKKISSELAANNWGDVMYELSAKPIFCRCGTEIIIKAVKGQWFINYADEKWKQQTKKLVTGISTFPPEYKEELPAIIDWVEARPCVRKRGLGTKFPLDREWTIEALSDSTIYMSFFIVSKYFNQKKIKLGELSEEFFDYVFLGKGNAKNAVWKKIRKEFEYWYPLDINSGGKEHKMTHFMFFLFNHSAVFPEKLWPKGIFVNWHVVREGQKMSKHLGNVLFWNDAVERWGVDAIRLYLLNGTSQWEDFDWKDKDCDIYMRHISNFYSLLSSMKFSGPKENADLWLESKMNENIREITKAMYNCEMKSAISLALFRMLSDFNWYLKRKKKPSKAAKIFVMNWLRCLSPFLPHVSEELWSKFGRGLAMDSGWPEYNEKKINKKIIELEDGLLKTIEDIKHVVKLVGKKNSCYLYVTSPKEKELFEGAKDFIKKEFGFGKIFVFRSSGKKIYDPQKRAGKAKYGKPGIYLE